MTDAVVLHGKLKGFTLGPAMQACDEMERLFAFAYATGIAPNAKEAAKLAGYSNPEWSRTGKRSNSLASSAARILHRPRVVEAIEEVCRSEFRTLVPLTIAAAKRVLLNDEHKDHVKMVAALLSRLGYGETASVAVNVTGSVAVNHTDEAVEHLRLLKGLGVPHDELLKIFGHAGLPRYERLLAERNRNAPKVIEHIPANEKDHADG
jgi:hypothetical protein